MIMRGWADLIFRPDSGLLMPERNRRFGSWWLIIGLAVLVHVVVMASLPMVVIPRAGHDDALFVRQAAYLLMGKWLGPYDELTLAKGPFYPMWLALNWASGLPLPVSQGLAYAGACLALMAGLLPWLRSRAIAVFGFLALLANPAMTSAGMLRVVRDNLYTSLAVAVFAAAVWWIRAGDGGTRARIGMAVLTGGLCAAFALTREEGVWLLVPLLLAGQGYAGWRSWQDRGRRLRRAAMEFGLVALAAAVTGLGTGAVALTNLAVYGVADVVEFKQTEFVAAYSALSRIRHVRPKPYVPVSREALEKAYAVSPTLSLLRPALEGGILDGYQAHGCEAHAIRPCDGEVRAAWFMWALRAAVTVSGQADSAVSARTFYGRVAEELNAACDDGRLACLPPRHTMMPPFQWERVPVAIHSALSSLADMAVQSEAVPPRGAYSCLIDSCERPWMLPVLLDLLHVSLFVDPSGALEGAPRKAVSKPDRDRYDAAGGQALPSQQRADIVAGFLTRVSAVYRTVLPGALGLGFAVCLVLAYRSLVCRRVEPLFLAALAAAAVVVLRCGLIGYADAVAILRGNIYLGPATPFLLLFPLLALTGLARIRRSMTLETSTPMSDDPGPSRKPAVATAPRDFEQDDERKRGS